MLILPNGKLQVELFDDRGFVAVTNLSAPLPLAISLAGTLYVLRQTRNKTSYRAAVPVVVPQIIPAVPEWKEEGE